MSSQEEDRRSRKRAVRESDSDTEINIVPLKRSKNNEGDPVASEAATSATDEDLVDETLILDQSMVSEVLSSKFARAVGNLYQTGMLNPCFFNLSRLTRSRTS